MSSFQGPPGTHFVSVPEARGKKHAEKVVQKTPQREGEFRPEIGRNGHFGDLGPSWGLDGGPDSQNNQKDLQNHTRDTQIQQKN